MSSHKLDASMLPRNLRPLFCTSSMGLLGFCTMSRSMKLLSVDDVVFVYIFFSFCMCTNYIPLLVFQSLYQTLPVHFFKKNLVSLLH